MGWTEDRVETLRKLWLDGFSASQIAKQLGGGLTRNAVIGKVHRLGLSGRAAPSQPQRPAFKATRPARPAPAPTPVVRRAEPVAQPEPKMVYVAEEAGSATVLTLGAHMCKWPIGDPSSDGFSFCGRVSSSEGPYCAHHAQVAYQAQPRKATSARRGDAELVRSLRRYI
ncbi:MAG: GcrA family cell cycle regulator [Caulobacteraceae bacterium]